MRVKTTYQRSYGPTLYGKKGKSLQQVTDEILYAIVEMDSDTTLEKTFASVYINNTKTLLRNNFVDFPMQNERTDR